MTLMEKEALIVAENVFELTGKTPIVKLKRISPVGGAEIWGKLEYYNPTGSIKDRIALAMIEDAERKGVLKPGATIIEPTSGNTGIALAAVAAYKGYKMIAVMPEFMSEERRKILQAYGAEVVLTPKEEDVIGALHKAEELVKEIPNSYMPNQFSNICNPKVHSETTAKEILAQTKSTLDAVIVAAGTGGTAMGIAGYFRNEAKHVKLFLVEPAGSAVLSGCEAGYHKIQGIGEGFIPELLDPSLFDGVVQVSDNEAFLGAKLIREKEAIFAGISSGANVSAALKVAKELGKGKTIVTILSDNGLRYLSTPDFI